MDNTDRRHFMGASDVAAALGLDPYRTPLALWREKTAAEPPAPYDDEDTLRGKLSEPVIEGLLRARGVELSPGGEHSIPGTPFTCHPDRLEVDGTVHEFKAPRRFVRGEWGEEGSDEIPMRHLVQVNVQMAAVRISRPVPGACITALCGDLRSFRAPWREEVAMAALQQAGDWWVRHVVAHVPPPATTLEDVRSFKVTKRTAVVNDELAEWLGRLRFVSHMRLGLEKLEKSLKGAVLAAASSVDGTLAEVIVDAQGKPLAHLVGRSRENVDTKLLRSMNPDLAAACTKTSSWHEVKCADEALLLVPADKLDAEVAKLRCELLEPAS